jgi:hypothetical protein
MNIPIPQHFAVQYDQRHFGPFLPTQALWGLEAKKLFLGTWGCACAARGCSATGSDRRSLCEDGLTLTLRPQRSVPAWTKASEEQKPLHQSG